tara:strand:+ start:2037 stop:2870 length:834 start_codon:yes stop_codon:yes gene_type:complete
MKNVKRPIGFHVRLYKNLQDVIEATEQMNLEVVQSFLLNESNNYVSLSDKVIHDFVHTKNKRNLLYYVHAAYWSSLTNPKSKMFVSLKKEVEIAQSLHSNGVVIHPGAARKGLSPKDIISYVAESVNELNQAYPQVPLLLENGPHAGRNFGGDIEHFAYLLEHIEKKELVGFCIDTAHAFVYGYNIAQEKSRHKFLSLVEELLGKNNIKLLHFNDSKDRCGSYIDKHETPGAGKIGKKALQDIMNHTLFKDVPVIMECSKDCATDIDIIQEISNWEQ